MEELQRFLLVAQERNLTKVAQKIFITQSALTQSIQRLERQLNTKLFTQKGKNLELTPDGQALVTISAKILDLWQKAKDPDTRKIIKPPITIGMYDNAALRLAKFIGQNTHSENFNLEFIIERSGTLLSHLQLGTIDIAITVLPSPSSVLRNPSSALHPPSSVICLKTFEEPLIPVSSKLFKTSLNEIPFILYNKGSNTRQQIDQTFIENGINPKISAESTSSTFMKELALLGTGVALLPENFVKQELKQGLFKKQKLNLKWNRDYGIFVHKNNKLKEINKLTDEIINIL